MGSVHCHGFYGDDNDHDFGFVVHIRLLCLVFAAAVMGGSSPLLILVNYQKYGWVGNCDLEVPEEVKKLCLI